MSFRPTAENPWNETAESRAAVMDGVMDADEPIPFRIVNEFAEHVARVRFAQCVAIDDAEPALKRLVDVCGARTGQSYKVRDLLYSLWHGQPASLLELVAVDWAIKRDLTLVMLAFGSEPKGMRPFFYDAISDAFKAAGLFDWFCEAHRAPEPT